MHSLKSQAPLAVRSDEALKPLSGKHQKFVEGIAAGLDNFAAYQAAYPDAGLTTAKSQAWRLLARPDIQAALARLRTKSEDAALMTLFEKRAYLAQVVRSSSAEVPRDSSLVQEVKITADGTETYRLPDKLRAIYLDCRLMGQIASLRPPPPPPAPEQTAEEAAIHLMYQVTHGHLSPPEPAPQPEAKTPPEPKPQPSPQPRRQPHPEPRLKAAPPPPPKSKPKPAPTSAPDSAQPPPDEATTQPVSSSPTPPSVAHPPKPRPVSIHGDKWVPPQQHMSRRYCGVPPAPPQPIPSEEGLRIMYGTKAHLVAASLANSTKVVQREPLAKQISKRGEESAAETH